MKSYFEFYRPYQLTREAIHVLCVGDGKIRQRMGCIDTEFFCLTPEQFPDAGDIRAKVQELQKKIRKFEPKGSEGVFNSTINRCHMATLVSISELVWDIFLEFSEFYNQLDSC